MPVDPVSMGAGIMGAISNYFANERTNQTNIQMAREANQANRDIAREQNEWNLMMWQMQNAYNDPSAQMARLKAAGINPALAYAQGGMMNEAAPAQEAAGATMVAPQVRPYYNDPLMMAQIANLNAQTDKTESESQAILSKLPEEVQNLQQARKESDANIANLNQNVLNLQEAIANMREDRKLTVEKQISESFNRTLASQEFQRKSQETVALVKKMAQDISESKAREKLTYEQERAVRAARHLDEQQFAFLAEANAYKLLGLQYDNILKQKSAILYDDQHVLNNMQSQLLGFDISNGRVVANRSERWLSEVSGNPLSRALDDMIGAASMLLAPVKGIISIK